MPRLTIRPLYRERLRHFQNLARAASLKSAVISQPIPISNDGTPITKAKRIKMALPVYFFPHRGQRVDSNDNPFLQNTHIITRLPRNMALPTFFRIRNSLSITDRVVDHGGSVFSNLRRSGWRQKTPEPNRIAYSQLEGFSTRHFE
jgi:hypothetical protein